MDRQREWKSPKEIRELLSIGRCKGFWLPSGRIVNNTRVGCFRIRDLERYLEGHRSASEASNGCG